ncbi:MAG: right-handed parallel beta-helix repeat-containing protein [Acutalibacteraceae bacterium]
MKKIYTFTVSFLVLFLLSFSASAQGETKTLQAVDAGGNVVASYEIISGNSSQNARTVIQKAINEAQKIANDSNPITIKIPTGEYMLDSTISVYSNMILDFQNSTVKRTANCGSFIKTGTAEDKSSGYDGYKNIVIKNAVLDAENIGDVAFIRFAHAQNVTIENITMQNSFGVHHQLTFAAVKNVKVKNCRFLNMNVSTIPASMNCEAIQIDILKEVCFGGYPEYDATTSTDVEITGCTFKNVPRGCGTHSAAVGTYLDNIKINNNVFENISGYAIRATNYRNSEINNNVIKNCGCGIIASDVTAETLSNNYAPESENPVIRPESNLTISSNTISLCDTDYSKSFYYGISIFGMVVQNAVDSEGNSFSGDFRARGIKIENNSITSSVKNKLFHAIDINGASGSSKTVDSDFCVTGNTFHFTDCQKDKNTCDAIRIQNSENLWLYNNKTTEDSKPLTAFVSVDGSKNIAVNSNECLSGGTYAVKMTASSDCTVDKNNFKNTSSFAVYAYDSCENISISSNKISGAKNYALGAKKSKNITFSKNTVTDDLKQLSAAISADGCTNVNALSNKISSSKGMAVRYSTVSGGKIEKNTAANCGENAIYVYSKSDNINVQSNTVSSCAKYALAAKDSKNITISSNKVTDNAGKLVSAVSVDACSNAVISSNTAEKTNSYGIRLVSSTASVTSNVLSPSKGYGIYLNSCKSKTTVSSNTVKSPAGVGIAVRSSNGVSLSKNTVSGGKSDGILFDKCTSSSASSNVLSKNGAYSVKVMASSKIKLSKNNISQPQNTAIYIYSKSSEIQAESNTIDSPKGDAISVNSGSSITVSGNKITNTKKKLVNAVSAVSSSKVTVLSNSISAPSQNAVMFKTVSTGNIEKNSITSCGTNGIYVYSSSKKVEVVSNTVSSPKTGIYIADSSGSNIKSNNIYSSKSSAVYLTGKTVYTNVYANYIYAPKGTAINLNKQASASNVSKNLIDIASASVSAIIVSDSASAEKINSNEINCKTKSKSKNLSVKCSSGIVVKSSKSKTTQIASNKIKNCSEYGIYILKLAKKPTVKNNTVTSCKYGIAYKSASLSSNSISKASKAKTKKL